MKILENILFLFCLFLPIFTIAKSDKVKGSKNDVVVSEDGAVVGSEVQKSGPGQTDPGFLSFTPKKYLDMSCEGLHNYQLLEKKTRCAYGGYPSQYHCLPTDSTEHPKIVDCYHDRIGLRGNFATGETYFGGEDPERKIGESRVTELCDSTDLAALKTEKMDTVWLCPFPSQDVGKVHCVASKFKGGMRLENDKSRPTVAVANLFKLAGAGHGGTQNWRQRLFNEVLKLSKDVKSSLNLDLTARCFGKVLLDFEEISKSYTTNSNSQDYIARLEKAVRQQNIDFTNYSSGEKLESSYRAIYAAWNRPDDEIAGDIFLVQSEIWQLINGHLDNFRSKKGDKAKDTSHSKSGTAGQ